MRLSEILDRKKEPTKGTRARRQVDLRSAKFGNDLTRLVTALTKDSRVKHSRHLNWRRPFLSKSRYMCGLQCPKKLWQTVYDPEPAEEPLPGTVRAWVSRSASRRGCASGIVPRCRPERLREPLCDLPSTRAATAGCRSHHHGCGRAARTADRLEWPAADFVSPFTTSSAAAVISLGCRVGG